MSRSREMDKIQESSCPQLNEISWNVIVSYIWVFIYQWLYWTLHIYNVKK